MNSTVHPTSDDGTTNKVDKRWKRKRIGMILGILGVIAVIAAISIATSTSVKADSSSRTQGTAGLLQSSKQDSGNVNPSNRDTDHCKRNLCLNSGRCEDIDTGYICHCTTPYEGTRCEIDVDECLSDPCLNGGTCEDLVGGYMCHCVTPYQGAHCEIENTCLPNPCLNDGTCIYNVAHENHTCSCVPGFTGTVCEINIDDCFPGACYGGVCIDGVNAYHCNCSAMNGIDLINTAWNKWAIQSSTHEDNYASRAVDDVINQDALEGLSCAVTSNVTGEESWWKVDLGQVSCVARVIISNRQDCCDDSIFGAELRVSSHYDMSDPNVCGTIHEPMANDGMISLECALGAVGRFLEVRLPRDEERLALCEVKVMVPDMNGVCEDETPCFGGSCDTSVDSQYTCDCNQVTENVAIGRLTWQSSTHGPGRAEKAVDGDTNPFYFAGKCTHSAFGDAHPWWRVDLAEPHCVKKVTIFTRGDCCDERLAGGKVFVSKNAALTDTTQCGPTISYSMSQQNSIDFNCNPGSVGRFVHFKQTNQGIISLCEVRVFAPVRGRYQPVMMWKTHADAQAYCAAQSVGGHLARLTSLDQHDYVVGLIRQSERELEDEADYWWVAGSYQVDQGWNFSDNSTLFFTAWHANGTSVLDEARCLRLSKQQDYQWDAALCSESAYFVCRYG